jgi:hypothetical protein
MSEHENENQPPAQESERSADTSIPFQIVKRETGATHYVDGGARTDLVRHAETGEPEQEYALVATIDGVQVTLQSWNAGRIETVVKSGQAAQRAQQQSTA